MVIKLDVSKILHVYQSLTWLEVFVTQMLTHDLFKLANLV